MQKRFRHRSSALVLCLSVVLALLAGGVFSARTAHAAQVTVFRFQGESALANFATFDSTGCIETSVILFGSDSITLTPPGGPQQMPNMGVEINKSNVCFYIDYFNASVFSSAGDFHLAANLSSATLTASQLATVDEVTGTPVNLDVSITWASTGSATRTATPIKFRTPSEVFNGIVVGFSSDAVATGTVTDGTTNYTPTPSTSATLADVTSGEVDLIKG